MMKNLVTALAIGVLGYLIWEKYLKAKVDAVANTGEEKSTGLPNTDTLLGYTKYTGNTTNSRNKIAPGTLKSIAASSKGVAAY